MFLIIIPIFLALCVLFAYLYAYVPFGVLSLSKRLSVRISFFIFYAIFTLLIAFARLDIVVLSPYAIAIVILSILILKRKGYFTNFTKARVAMAGVCLLVFTWQLEVPQKAIMYIMVKTSQVPEIIIFDNNYTVQVNENKIDGFGDMESNFFAAPSSEFKKCIDNVDFCSSLPVKRLFKNIYVYESIKANEENDLSKRKKVGVIYGLYYAKPLLARLPIYGHYPAHYRSYDLKSDSWSKLDEEFELLLNTLKQHQKGEKNEKCYTSKC